MEWRKGCGATVKKLMNPEDVGDLGDVPSATFRRALTRLPTGSLTTERTSRIARSLAMRNRENSSARFPLMGQNAASHSPSFGEISRS